MFLSLYLFVNFSFGLVNHISKVISSRSGFSDSIGSFARLNFLFQHRVLVIGLLRFVIDHILDVWIVGFEFQIELAFVKAIVDRLNISSIKILIEIITDRLYVADRDTRIN